MSTDPDVSQKYAQVNAVHNILNREDGKPMKCSSEVVELTVSVDILEVYISNCEMPINVFEK